MSYLKGPDVEKALPHFQRNTSVLELLEACLRKNGDATAMVEGQTGKTASFADILHQSTTVAAGLQSAGITAGDYVVLCCDKSILSYSLFLGVMFTGASAVLCPPNTKICIQVEGQTGKTASFADILQQSTTVAAGLQSAGITAGDYVVLCFDKSTLSYSLLLAVMVSGATAVLCPPNNKLCIQVEGQTAKTASFADILQQSTTVAAGLQSAGITAGDYVVLCCDKSILSYSLLLGVMFTGATAVLCPTENANIIHLITKGHRVKAAFYHKKYSEPVKTSLNGMDTPPALVALVDSEDPQMNAVITSKAECVMYKVDNPEKHIAMILFSSGTTGDPKGIQMSDTAIALMGFLFAPQVETLFSSAPLYWYTGVMSFISSIFNSFTFVMSNVMEARDNMQLVQKFKAEGWFLSTGSMSHCTRVENVESYDCSSIKEVYVGGELMLKNVMEAFLTKVVGGQAMVQVMYGITEGGIMAKTNSNDRALLETSLQPGLFLHLSPGVEIKILDDDGKPVASGNMGEVWFKSIGMTPGYWSLPELNRQVFDKDGFFRSGDAAFCNHQGHLFHRGRVSDLITYKGVKVSSAEAEEVLMSHPAVLYAVVIGKGHPTDTQHSTALVVMQPGSRTTEEEIAAFVNGQVDDMRKLRGGVHFVQSLPRIGVGKINRKLLRT